MAGKEHLEHSAFRMYVHGASQKEIGATLDVSETTITKWKAKFNWDDRKQIEINHTQFTVEKLKKLLAEKVSSLENLDDHKVADSITKITSALEKLDSHFDFLGSVLKVTDEWVSWSAANNDKLFKELQNALPQFLAHARTKFRS